MTPKMPTLLFDAALRLPPSGRPPTAVVAAGAAVVAVLVPPPRPPRPVVAVRLPVLLLPPEIPEIGKPPLEQLLANSDIIKAREKEN